MIDKTHLFCNGITLPIKTQILQELSIM